MNTATAGRGVQETITAENPLGPAPTSSRRWRIAAAVLLASLLGGTALAQTDRLPNVVALPAKDISLVANPAVTNGWLIRFSTTTWNAGSGPLELVAGEVESDSQRRRVYQRIYRTDGTWLDRFAGSFVYHPAHNHFHFERYAWYILQPLNAPGASQRQGSKTTFCIMDTNRIDSQRPGSPGSAYYASCGNAVQGMSIGWGDTYGSHLAGQSVDFTGEPDGLYQLKISADPKAVLRETTRSDNISCVLLSVRKPNLTVLDQSGDCTAVRSITPNSARTGTQVNVIITGYEFHPGIAVSFEGGSGPRPVASNVALIEDTAGLDKLSATVTVPFALLLGSKPVWNLRVGEAGLLPQAFKVTSAFTATP